MNYVDPKLQARQTQIVEVLEMVCESLELSTSQFALAKQRYEGVGALPRRLRRSGAAGHRHLSAGLDRAADDREADRRQRARRRPGRPCARPRRPDLARGAEEGHRRLPPRQRQLRAAPGGDAPLLAAELRQRIPHGHHALDPEPELPVRRRTRPRQDAQEWKASNPKGYKRLFEQRAKLAPVIRLRKHVALDSARASVEPYPEAGGFKGILRRTVQIAKRHRDIMFVDDPDVAPLSVIITTLASRSYEWCVTNREYDNELDLLFDVIRHMPDTIEMPPRRRPRPVVHLERDHRGRELRREVEPPAGARRGVLHLARPLLLRSGATRSCQRPRPPGRHPEGPVRIAAGERRDRLAHRARLDGAPRRQPARRPRHRPERRRDAGVDVGAG